MSQQQTFSGMNSPVIPDIEFIQGTSGGPVGADPATFTIYFTSDDLAIDGNALTYSENFVNLVKWTPYVVDDVEPAPYTTIQSAIDKVSTYQNVINFNIDFVALNSIVATVDSVALTPVVFAVDQATTIAALAAMIGTATDVVSSTVTGARQITVVFASGSFHEVNSVITTLGATQPVATITSSSTALPQLILVRYGSGNYVENLTIPANITIMGVLDGTNSSVPVLITGTHSVPNSGGVEFINLRMNDATAIVSSTSAGSGTITWRNCSVGVTNGFTADLTAWTGSINFIGCIFSGLDDGLVNNATGTASISLSDSIVGGGGGVLATGGFLQAKGSTLYCAASFTGSASVTLSDSITSGMTFAGSSTLSAVGGQLNGASKASITQSSTGAISLINVGINSNNNPAIAGAGAGVLTLAGVPFLDNTVIAGTLTTAVYDWKPYGTSGTSLTATNGTASFDSDDFTVTNGFVEIKGNVVGSTTTVGAVTGDIITIPLGTTPSNYSFIINVSAFESSTPAGAQYFIIASARTDGATASLVGLPDPTINEDAALVAADCDLVVVGNSAIVRATGVLALTINWSATVQVLQRT